MRDPCEGREVLLLVLLCLGGVGGSDGGVTCRWSCGLCCKRELALIAMPGVSRRWWRCVACVCVGEVWKRRGDLNCKRSCWSWVYRLLCCWGLTRVACFFSLNYDHSREKKCHLRGDRLPIAFWKIESSCYIHIRFNQLRTYTIRYSYSFDWRMQ